MKLWKASTARISQKIALISPHQSVPFFAGFGAAPLARRRGRSRRSACRPLRAVAVAQAVAPRAWRSMMTNACANGWSSVIVRWIMRGVARRGQRVKPLLGAAGERQRRLRPRQVDHADVLHEHAALEAGADRLREGLLGGEALGVGAGAGERPPLRLGALDLGEHAPLEALAEPVERSLDPLDVAQVRADADDHDGPTPSPRRSRGPHGLTSPRSSLRRDDETLIPAPRPSARASGARSPRGR